MAEEASAGRDLHIIRLLITSGILNPTHHFTAEEWVSMISSPMGEAEEWTLLENKATLGKIQKIIFFVTDSGMLHYLGKGTAGAYTSMLESMNRPNEQKHWQHTNVMSRAGAEFIHFIKYLEAILFECLGGSEAWRAQDRGCALCHLPVGLGASRGAESSSASKCGKRGIRSQHHLPPHHAEITRARLHDAGRRVSCNNVYLERLWL